MTPVDTRVLLSWQNLPPARERRLEGYQQQFHGDRGSQQQSQFIEKAGIPDLPEEDLGNGGSIVEAQ
jgi:hypothetical protein